MVDDLDQVAAGVVENRRGHRPHLQRLLGEAHTEPAQPLELGPDVVDGELGERDAVRDERVLERLRRGMGAGLQQELGALGVRFTQPPSDMGSVTTAVLDDTCGNLLQIAAM